MDNYNDIIHLPHHQSATRPRMSNRDRAAQFAPFAALTSHGDAVKETARLTDNFSGLGEDEILIISAKLQMLMDNISERPRIEVTYFVPDESKAGGAFTSKIGNARRVDEYERVIIFTDGKIILIDNIVDIKGGLFSSLERDI